MMMIIKSYNHFSNRLFKEKHIDLKVTTNNMSTVYDGALCMSTAQSGKHEHVASTADDNLTSAQFQNFVKRKGTIDEEMVTCARMCRPQRSLYS